MRRTPASGNPGGDVLDIVAKVVWEFDVSARIQRRKRWALTFEALGRRTEDLVRVHTLRHLLFHLYDRYIDFRHRLDSTGATGDMKYREDSKDGKEREYADYSEQARTTR